MKLTNDMSQLHAEESLSADQVGDLVDFLHDRANDESKDSDWEFYCDDDDPLTDDELEYLDIIGSMELLDFSDDDDFEAADAAWGEWDTKEIK